MALDRSAPEGAWHELRSVAVSSCGVARCRAVSCGVVRRRAASCGVVRRRAASCG
eukprot:gene44396-10544_t